MRISGPATLDYKTFYTYDLLDDLASVTQGSQGRSFAWNMRGWPTSATNPETGTSATTWSYDNNGNQVYRQDGRGIETCYAYDVVNRPTLQVYYTGTGSSTCSSITNNTSSPVTSNVTYAYDSGATNPNGRLVSITNGAAVDAVTGYDELGRITGSSQAIGGGSALTFAYTYNLADALLQTTYPSGRTVTNSYDVANRVTGVTGALSGTSTPYVGGTCSSGICYAASGAPSSYTYNNGVARSYSYNSLLQPTAMTDTLAGTTLLSLGYTFGTGAGLNNGNPTQVASGGSGAGAGFTQNYGYDKLNRLCAAGEATGAVSITSCTAPTTGVNWAQNLSLDRYGNMWAPTASQAGVSGIPALGWMPTSSSQINAANNHLTVSGLNYDTGGGNQTTFLGTSTTSPIQYDAENRQVQVVTASSTTYSYTYDGLGQRVSRTVGGATTEYVHDVFGNLAAEYNPPGSAACTTCYLSWDHLGSTRMVTDGSTTDGTTGQIVARHDYLPFGVEIPNGVAGRSGVWGVTDGLSPKFTGQDHDAETFLEFYQARYLAAGLGRFMSVDPGNAGADLGDPQTWNMYGYVRNNPLTYIDPSGMDETAEDCISDPESCEAGDGTWGTGGGGGGTGGTPPNGPIPYPGVQQGPGGALPWQNQNGGSGSQPGCTTNLPGCPGYTPFTIQGWLTAAASTARDLIGLHAGPMLSSAPDPYKMQDTYLSVSARCMFKTGGDNPWGDIVRGCLAQMYQARPPGLPYDKVSNHDHLLCYAKADREVGAKAARWGLVVAVTAAAGCKSVELPIMIQ
jgi:RHS repeat-associated protein